MQKEPPSTAQVTAGRETIIEIQKGKSGLGLSIVGGADTLLVRDISALVDPWNKTLLLCNI